MVNIQHLVVVCGLAFCSNLIYGLTSFGAGIVFQCGWHMAELAHLVEGGMNKGTSNLAAFMFITRALQVSSCNRNCFVHCVSLSLLYFNCWAFVTRASYFIHSI